MGDTELSEEVQGLLTSVRHGVELPNKVVQALGSYFVEELEVESVDEISKDDPDELEASAVCAYQAAFTKELPPPHAHRVRKWAGEQFNSKANASSGKKDTLASSVEVGAVVEEDRVKAAKVEVSGMDLSPIEQAKAIKDMAAQGLSCKRLVGLSASLTLGRVCKPSETSMLKYGEDPALSDLAKNVRKAKKKLLANLLSNKNFSETGAFFSHLMMCYSQDGMVEEASLIAAWWAETSGCFSSENEMLFEYLTEYFEKYAGRGLPVSIDTALIVRLRNAAASSISKEDFKKLKETVATLVTDLSKVKSELNTVNQKMATLSKKPTKEELEEKRAAAKCHNCGKMGHYGYECPEPKKKGNKKDDED